MCFSYKNGSLTRERIRNSAASGSWKKFSDALSNTTPGNNGNIGIYLDVQEITPSAVGTYRFNAKNEKVSKFTDEEEVRACVEGQFLAKRYHAERLGYTLGASSRVLATGGASSNKEILQVLSDVFNASVYTLVTANSACLGCAYRAKHGIAESKTFEEIVQAATPYKLATTPNGCDYSTTRYGRLERIITSDV